MTTNLQKWGNSQGLRIPKVFIEQLDLHENEKLDITLEGNVIVIKKSRQHMTFEERMKGYTGKYTLSEWDTGAPRGKEIF